MWTKFLRTSTATLLAGTCSAGLAQAPAEPDTATAGGDMIVVTGTRQVNRTVSESLSPIQVLSPDTLQRSGKPGLQEVLTNVLPSFNLPSQAGGGLSNIIRVAQLRGLNPDQVLVLVNGKRRHPGSIVNISGTIGIGAQPTDLNLIPPGAIARIEVLTDGAAAQYGSDAIAGVINIILKNNDHGGSLAGQIGQYYKGDGENGTLDANAGFKLGEDGFLSLSASYLNQEKTGRAIPATITPRYYPGDPRNNTPAGIVQKGYGIPKAWIVQGGYNMEKPLGDTVTLYSFGTVGYQRAKQYQGFRAANNINNVIAIYPDGFQPVYQARQRDFGVTGGIRAADVAGWALDFSGTYGRNRTDSILFNSVSPTYGTTSPTTFYIGRLTASQLAVNLDLRRSYDVGFATPLAIAVGSEFKLDGYQIKAGQPNSYLRGPFPVLTGPSAGLFTNIPGSQAYSGYTPQDESANHRHSFAGYIDLETEILPKLEVGLAGRYEDYSDFGSNFSFKFSSRYQIAPPIAVRGTVSTGFRAPSLGQQFSSTSSTSQFRGVDYKIALVPVSSPAAQILGATPLKAEKAFNLGAGLVLTPFEGFTLTVDGYRIDIDDRIVLSANIGLLSTGALNPTVAALLLAQGIQGVNVGRYFLNGVDTRTRGVDVVGTYTSRLGAGRLTLTGAFNAGDTKIRRLSAAASQPLFGNVVFNQVAQDQLTLSTPANKLILSQNYDIGRFGFFTRQTRYGHYIAPSTVTGGYSYATPEWTVDVEVRYRLNDAIELGVGAQNVLDNYPDRANPRNFNPATFNGANYYNAQSPFGISGGNYYARMLVKL